MTPERDDVSCCIYAVALAAATLAATTAGALVDMLGFRSATLALNIGVGGITFTGVNKIEFVLQHGNLSDGSDLANVTDADIINIDSVAPASVTNGIIRSLTAAKAAADVQKVGYIGGKRYLKLTPTFSGTHGSGTAMAASVELEGGDYQRVA
jgi:hypothetical protein